MNIYMKIFNCEDDDSAKLYYEMIKGELVWKKNTI